MELNRTRTFSGRGSSCVFLDERNALREDASSVPRAQSPLEGDATQRAGGQLTSGDGICWARIRAIPSGISPTLTGRLCEPAELTLCGAMAYRWARIHAIASVNSPTLNGSKERDAVRTSPLSSRAAGSSADEHVAAQRARATNHELLEQSAQSPVRVARPRPRHRSSRSEGAIVRIERRASRHVKHVQDAAYRAAKLASSSMTRMRPESFT